MLKTFLNLGGGSLEASLCLCASKPTSPFATPISVIKASPSGTSLPISIAKILSLPSPMWSYV